MPKREAIDMTYREFGPGSNTINVVPMIKVVRSVIPNTKNSHEQKSRCGIIATSAWRNLLNFL